MRAVVVEAWGLAPVVTEVDKPRRDGESSVAFEAAAVGHLHLTGASAPEGVDSAVGGNFPSPCTTAWVSLHDISELQRVSVSPSRAPRGRSAR